MFLTRDIVKKTGYSILFGLSLVKNQSSLTISPESKFPRYCVALYGLITGKVIITDTISCCTASGMINQYAHFKIEKSIIECMQSLKLESEKRSADCLFFKYSKNKFPISYLEGGP